jgi:hypothetical protein
VETEAAIEFQRGDGAAQLEFSGRGGGESALEVGADVLRFFLHQHALTDVCVDQAGAILCGSGKPRVTADAANSRGQMRLCRIRRETRTAWMNVDVMFPWVV